MELNPIQMEIILDNFGRKCAKCETWLQPLSTRCITCGKITPRTKVFLDSYFEHFELHMCNECNEQTYHFCMHPEIGCTIDELQIFCVKCIMKYVAKNGGIEIIKQKEE